MSDDLVIVHLSIRFVEADGDAQSAYRAELIYDPTRPYTVKLSMTETPGAAPVVWIFARDLLAEGLERPAGLGDLIVWPDGERVMIKLFGQDRDTGEFNWQTGAMARRSVRHFLVKSYDLVPVGVEPKHLDIDAALAALFSQAAE